MILTNSIYDNVSDEQTLPALGELGTSGLFRKYTQNSPQHDCKAEHIRLSELFVMLPTGKPTRPLPAASKPLAPLPPFLPPLPPLPLALSPSSACLCCCGA